MFLIVLSIPLMGLANHPAPKDFQVNSEGEIFGKLEDGSKFSQTNIFSEPRIQKFTWEDGFWYVSDKGIIYADGDMEALSTYLSMD